MREIKFRGYAIPIMLGNQWQYGFGFEKLELSEKYALKLGRDNDLFLYTERGTIEVHEKSVGQYTGLKDKNGVEIYEGDIVEMKSMIPGTFDFFGFVHFLEGSYCIVNVKKEKAINLFSESSLIEVIGNIYEHKHLLEGLK